MANTVLKNMLNNLINDKSAEATLDFHNYLTDKMRELSGLKEARSEPEIDEYTGPDAEDLVNDGLAQVAFELQPTGLEAGMYANEISGWWLYDGWETGELKSKKIVATVVLTSGEHENMGPMIYPGKITAKQAARWYARSQKEDDSDSDGYSF